MPQRGIPKVSDLSDFTTRRGLITELWLWLELSLRRRKISAYLTGGVTIGKLHLRLVSVFLHNTASLPVSRKPTRSQITAKNKNCEPGKIAQRLII